MRIVERILKKESFDPALSLFNVLSTSSTEGAYIQDQLSSKANSCVTRTVGMTQIIPSVALSEVIAEHQNIASYLWKSSGEINNSSGYHTVIPKNFMEPYIMSLCMYKYLRLIEI